MKKNKEMQSGSCKSKLQNDRDVIKGRLGLVIDSYCKRCQKLLKQKVLLEKIGYETAMVFVNTSLETALDKIDKEKEVSQIRLYKAIMQQSEKTWVNYKLHLVDKTFLL